MNRAKHTFSTLILAATLLFSAAAMESAITARQPTEDANIEGRHPLVAFVTVGLGGFRGIVADILWLRGSFLQDQGRVVELVQLAEWITHLEPHSDEVWSYHAWNLSYNVSVLMSRPEDRWRWVQAGINLLRDRGLTLNPRRSHLHHELGWMFQHKIGSNTDDAGLFYKKQLALSVEKILPGGQLPARLPIETQNETYTRFKMKATRMFAIEERFGKLDWRLPHAHSLYWAYTGMPYASEGDAVGCARMIIVSLTHLMRAGSLTQTPSDNTPWRYETRPDLSLAPKIEAQYDIAISRFPDHDFKMPRLYFLALVCEELYKAGRIVEADSQYRQFRQAIPPGNRIPSFKRVIRGQTHLEP